MGAWDRSWSNGAGSGVAWSPSGATTSVLRPGRAATTPRARPAEAPGRALSPGPLPQRPPEHETEPPPVGRGRRRRDRADAGARRQRAELRSRRRARPGSQAAARTAAARSTRPPSPARPRTSAATSATSGRPPEASSSPTRAARSSSQWPAVGGNVYAVAPDGANGFFIGGAFSSVGTKHANNIAHIKSDGTLDTAWTGSTDGTVWALAVSGGTVYAGGEFTHAGGAARTKLAAFSASTGALVTAFTANATGSGATVLALEASGSLLYVGGHFTTLAGSSRTNLGAVDAGTGAASSWTGNTLR